MTTLTQPGDISEDPPLPRITPAEWADLLEQAAADRGLPPDPWPLPLP